jgi:hypothetical protein
MTDRNGVQLPKTWEQATLVKLLDGAGGESQCAGLPHWLGTPLDEEGCRAGKAQLRREHKTSRPGSHNNGIAIEMVHR